MANGNDAYDPDNYLDYLEYEPQAAWFAQEGVHAKTPSQRRTYRNMFKQAHQQFLGGFGQEVMAMTPAEEFTRFSTFANQFPFQQEFFRFSPRERGEARGQYAPRTRFLF
jgi:hypothetical protein